jgi:hypothetical protein
MTVPWRARALCAVLVALVVVAAPVRADAYSPDPAAPPGASIDWLPEEDWVQQRWLPYDEPTLERLLRADRFEVQRWVHARRTLWSLATRNGVRPQTVLHQLVAPWKRISPARHDVMLSRAKRTLTQPHLAQHMLFHTYHLRSVSANWSRVFGVSVAQTVAEARASRLCYLDVGARHRGSATTVQRDFAGVLRSVAREGVRRHEVPRAEARRNLQFQLEQMVPFLNWRPTLG